MSLPRHMQLQNAGNVLILFGCVLLALSLTFSFLRSTIFRAPTQVPSTVAPSTIVHEKPEVEMFHRDAMCLDDGGHAQSIDKETFEGGQFKVLAPVGCWELIVMPKAWHGQWHEQDLGSPADFQMYYMGATGRVHGPLGWHAESNFTDCGDKCWVQATRPDEELLFWNDQAKAAEEAKEGPHLSQLVIRDSDPHICNKPEDAYYEQRGPARPAPAGSGGMSNPQFLFDTHHEDNTINWAQGFQGTVPVCFVVDDKGDPTKIEFLHSPGEEIEKRITERISGWRYKPGTMTQNYLDDPHPISVEVAFDFVFQ